VLAALWFGFTVNGYLAARRHRFADHRRNMLCSVTLAFSIITNRIWNPILYMGLQPMRTACLVATKNASSGWWPVWAVGSAGRFRC